MNDTIDSSTLNVPSSFHLLRLDRPNSSRGGCGIVINKKVEYKELQIDHNIENIEAIWIKLKHCNINICSFYRSNNYCSLDNFIDYMHICMKKFQGKKVIWIGDVNVDQNNINSTVNLKVVGGKINVKLIFVAKCS